MPASAPARVCFPTTREIVQLDDSASSSGGEEIGLRRESNMCWRTSSFGKLSTFRRTLRETSQSSTRRRSNPRPDGFRQARS